MNGCDPVLRYSGTVTELPDGRLDVALRMTVPPGAVLVQGTSPQDATHERSVRHVFPANFGNGEPEVSKSPPGIVRVMVQRIPDEFASAAVNGFTLNEARKLIT